eukprot:g12819.t1
MSTAPAGFLDEQTAPVAEALQGMGFEPDLAAAAAALSRGRGVEAALDLIDAAQTSPAGTAGLVAQAVTAAEGGTLFQRDATDGDGAAARRTNQLAGLVDEEESSSDDGLEEHKAVFVVRKDLNMSPGKIAAQVAHAALALVSADAQSVEKVHLWQSLGEKIVVCECADAAQFAVLKQKAAAERIVCASVHDAGRTEVEEGSETVVGFGPDGEEAVNRVTGKLRLLK